MSKKETLILSEDMRNVDDIQIITKKGDHEEIRYMSREDWLKEKEERQELEDMERQVNRAIQQRKQRRGEK